MRLPILIVALALLAAGCVEEEKSGSRPLIAVTSYPMYEFVSNVAGDGFEVWLMLPQGLNAHSYEPTPQDIVKLNRADAFVYTNDYFELWARKTIESSDNRDILVIRASDYVDLMEPDDPELGAVDPHTWLSVRNAVDMVDGISQGLIEKYPEEAEGISSRRDAYIDRLEALDGEIAGTSASCERREMFVSHAAFGYFARDYGFRQVPVVKSFEPSGDDLTLAEVDMLIRAAKEAGATHIFFEEYVSPKMSEEIADEIGGSSVRFSPMEAYGEEELDSGYIEIMEGNRQRLAEALGCG